MSSKRSLLTSAVGGAVIALAASQASASSFSDGNFSSPSGGGTFTTYFADGSGAGATFGPWTVTSGSIDLIGGYWQSPTVNGGSVDLDGDSPGAISQSFTATPGAYNLTFFLSGNPDGLPDTKSMTVALDGTPIAGNPYTYTLIPGVNTETNMLYLEFIVPVTLGAGPQSLSFSSNDINTPYGPAIGGVSFDAVGGISGTPLPSTWTMLIGGFMGLGFFAYRGSRKRASVVAA